MQSRSQSYELTYAECQQFADNLDDTPENVIAIHSLRQGLCHVYVTGNPSQFDGAIIDAIHIPGEPLGFGEDAIILWNLLQSVQEWWCVNVTLTCAQELGPLIQSWTGTQVHYYGDIYHTLERPVIPFCHPSVRQVTLDDLPLLEAAPPEVRGNGFGSTRRLLSKGIVAAAIEADGVVAIAYTAARSQRYADVAVSTLEAWRGRGLATAAATIVAEQLQKVGQTPVWSTGEGNYASLCIARKLGFTRVSQRTYILLDQKRK